MRWQLPNKVMKIRFSGFLLGVQLNKRLNMKRMSITFFPSSSWLNKSVTCIKAMCICIAVVELMTSLSFISTIKHNDNKGKQQMSNFNKGYQI